MDLKILKVAIEAQFKPSLTFYSKQSEIGNKIWEKIYPDWQTDGTKIIFKDLKDKEISVLEFRRVLVIKEDVGDYTSVSGSTERFLSVMKAYLESLPDGKLLRLGLRVIGYYNPELKLNEIAKVMQPKVYPDSKSPIYEITAKEFVDVGFAVVYPKQGYKIRLQTGPVTKDELLGRSQLSLPISEAELPDNSLFFDVDFFKEEPNKGLEEKFCKDGLQIIKSDLTNLIKFIFD